MNESKKCQLCDQLATHDGLTLCHQCFDDIYDDRVYDDRRAEGLEEQPGGDEGDSASYRADMIDAGRGRLLR